MKLPARSTPGPRERTRRAILDAMADVIVDTNGIGFSVQAVADRAGLTHRTVYNHFPSREVLCEAFSQYVDGLLAAAAADQDVIVPPSRQASLPLESLPIAAHTLYRICATHDHYVRAYVMLMFANRRPLESWQRRTRAFETLIAESAGAHPPLPTRQAAAAIRLFLSTFGWHLLTEQCGLSTDEAAATGAWATRTLLEAATAGRANTTRRRPSAGRAPQGAKAKSRRRRL